LEKLLAFTLEYIWNFVEKEYTSTAVSAERLDKVIVLEWKENPSPSRAQIAKWIKEGVVKVNGLVVTKPGIVLSVGDLIQITLLPPLLAKPLDLTGLDVTFPEVLYQDDDIVVINKPAGLTVHPGAGTSGTPTLVDLLEPMGFKVQAGETGRPGIVHRLDKNTSGIMVVARTAAAHADLSRQFAERLIEKKYFALVHESPRRRTVFGIESKGTISFTIGRDPSSRTKMTTGGKRSAETEWQVEERFSHAVLLALFPKTGRTHQIRVHCAAQGAPLIGDELYKDTNFNNTPVVRIENQLKRHALHACSLRLTHPTTHEVLHFEAPLPEDFLKCIEQLRLYDSTHHITPAALKDVTRQ
jgi:23S rRNA pseudouridine1911/1915/1917 synthase